MCCLFFHRISVCSIEYLSVLSYVGLVFCRMYYLLFRRRSVSFSQILVLFHRISICSSVGIGLFFSRINLCFCRICRPKFLSHPGLVEWGMLGTVKSALSPSRSALHSLTPSHVNFTSALNHKLQTTPFHLMPCLPTSPTTSHAPPSTQHHTAP
jgi:hypothetical protein